MDIRIPVLAISRVVPEPFKKRNDIWLNPIDAAIASPADERLRSGKRSVSLIATTSGLTSVRRPADPGISGVASTPKSPNAHSWARYVAGKNFSPNRAARNERPDELTSE